MSKAPSEVSSLTRTSVRSNKKIDVSVKKESGGQDVNGMKAPPSEVGGLSNAPTTTTVLEKKLTTLTERLEAERQARIKAQQELKRTCSELEALETVLRLRDAPEKKKTGYAGRL